MGRLAGVILTFCAAFIAAPAAGQTAPKAYLLVNLDVHDPATFSKYREAVPTVIEKYGGRFIVAGTETKALEGNLPFKRLVVLEFPSSEAVERYRASPEYAAIKDFRLKAAHTDVVLLQGVAPR